MSSGCCELYELLLSSLPHCSVDRLSGPGVSSGEHKILTWLNDHLTQFSYLRGYSLSPEDFALYHKLCQLSLNLQPYFHVARWFRHISSFVSPTLSNNRLPSPQLSVNDKDQLPSHCSNAFCSSNSSIGANVALTQKSSKMPSENKKPSVAHEGGGTLESNEFLESILRVIDQQHPIDSLDIASILNDDHQKIVGGIKSLESLGNMIKTEPVSCKRWELTGEGKEIADHGSHEAILFNKIPKDGIEHTVLMKLPNANIGFSKAIAAGWVLLDKKCTPPKVFRKVESIDDVVQKCLQKIAKMDLSNISDAQKADFKKRKLLNEVTVKSFRVDKDQNFSLTIRKLETELTPEMIATGSWRELTFKPYNFKSLGQPAGGGRLHPLLKVRAELRKIFFEMGFTEMPTNNYVESSFWNFDALFQPQQHPARDAHDTFFLSDPMNAKDFPLDYMERVRKVHAEGGFGSEGYKYDWKESEARKNLLRTHTTAVSARMLYKLAQEKTFRPVKYFSIDRVFRNETLDATHLAEFHQVEGVVADKGLSLGHLIGILHEFFNKLGIKRLRFKPAYNPYTEPSMEIFSYHDGLKKWVEIGNSGVFRPEMLLPMGLPEDVNVIAWGLSLERPTMIKYGYDNIRDLIGPRISLQMVYDNPICQISAD